MTLFCVLVVNNWFVVVEGFAAVASRGRGSGLFLSFRVIGVLLFLNIVVAFILYAFLSEHNKARSSRGWYVVRGGRIRVSRGVMRPAMYATLVSGDCAQPSPPSSSIFHRTRPRPPYSRILF